ncbi:MAG: hypothetical protein WA118_08225 [Carboxydocellales bacterium]
MKKLIITFITIVASIIVISALSAGLVEQFVSFDFKTYGDEKTWISFYGSFLGALVGAAAVIYATRNQIQYANKENIKKELPYLHLLAKALSSYKDYLAKRIITPVVENYNKENYNKEIPTIDGYNEVSEYFRKLQRELNEYDIDDYRSINLYGLDDFENIDSMLLDNGLKIKLVYYEYAALLSDIKLINTIYECFEDIEELNHFLKAEPKLREVEETSKGEPDIVIKGLTINHEIIKCARLISKIKVFNKAVNLTDEIVNSLKELEDLIKDKREILNLPSKAK